MRRQTIYLNYTGVLYMTPQLAAIFAGEGESTITSWGDVCTYCRLHWSDFFNDALLTEYYNSHSPHVRGMILTRVVENFG